MIKSIQILRALAALLVVYAHFEFSQPSIGAFGVDIFFIISGFIMAFIVDKNPRSFFYRRVIRIVPLYFSMTGLTILLYLMKPAWFRNVIVTREAIMKSLLFIPYRIKGSGPILSLGWTLNYEMFFYLCIAICLAIWGKKGMAACLSLLSTLVIVAAVFPPENYVLRFFSANIILEFVCGSLLYYFSNRVTIRDGSLLKYAFLTLGALSFLFLIYANAFLYTIPMRFWLYGVPAVFVTQAFLLMENRVDGKNPLHRLGILLGDASYAMYLVHPFVIYAFIRLVFARLPWSGAAVQFAELIGTIVIVCAVSIGIHKWYERPVVAKLKSILDIRFDKDKALS